MGKKSYWYILYVGSENTTLYEHCLRENGFDVFLPKMEKIHKKSGVHQLVELLLFPDHLFVSSLLDLSVFQDKLNRVVHDNDLTIDIHGMITLSVEKQNLLSRLMDENHVIKHSTGVIEESMTYVTNGPLKNLESKITKIDRHKRLAQLNLEVLGKTMQASLEITKKI